MNRRARDEGAPLLLRRSQPRDSLEPWPGERGKATEPEHVGAIEPWAPTLCGAVFERAPTLTLSPLRWLFAPSGVQSVGGAANTQDFRGTLKRWGVDKAPPFERATPEKVRWTEGFRFIESTFVVDAAPRAWEIWQIPVGDAEVLTIERISTYLQLTAGAGVAPYFVTGPLTDPLAEPVGPLGEVVSARWVADVTQTKQSPNLLVNQPPSLIPLGEPVVGLPRTWSDLRYAHGARYSEARQHVICGPALVRFFVVLSFTGQGAGGPGVRVRAGSLAGGYRVSGSGMTHADMMAMTRRS